MSKLNKTDVKVQSIFKNRKGYYKIVSFNSPVILMILNLYGLKITSK